MNKKAKVSLVLGSAIVLSLGLTACGSSTATSNGGGSAVSGQTFTFRLADIQPADYPTVVGDNEFAKLAKERTNGRITIQVYPKAQLGDPQTLHELEQQGANFILV